MQKGPGRGNPNQTIFVHMDSHDPGHLLAPTTSCLPFPPSSRATRHPKRIVIEPHFNVLCWYAIIHRVTRSHASRPPSWRLLLERPSAAECLCDSCCPDLVQFGVSCSFLFAQGAPCPDSRQHASFCTVLMRLNFYLSHQMVSYPRGGIPLCSSTYP